MTNTTEKILETAERLFYERGFNNVGVDTIRDEVGCSKTTIYKKFSSKEQLIEKTLSRRHDYFKNSLQNYVDDKSYNYSAIQRIFEWHRNWFCDVGFNGCLFVKASIELFYYGEGISDTILKHKTWVYDFIYEKIGDMPHKHKRELADLVMVHLEGLISLYLIYGGNSELTNRFYETSLKSILVNLEFCNNNLN